MPTCFITDSKPKVRPSSGMMGTMSLPISGFFNMPFSMLTKPMVVEMARAPEPASQVLKNSSVGATKVLGGTSRVGR